LSEIETSPRLASRWRRIVAAGSAAVTRFVNFIGRAEPVYGLGGPLFEKELRVAGRRGRMHILRACYLLALSGFVGIVWLSTTWATFLSTPPVYAAYSMADAGRYIITVIVWFQFVVLQLMAVVMLSTSISDEIYQRTLGVLMTTPITSLQIVAGKLLARMVQVVLFIAVSLPMLLLTQALGGVSWSYVLSGLAVTLATVLVAGSLSMYFSISSRRSGILAILKTLAAMGVLFILLPWAWNDYGAAVTSQQTVQTVLVNANPYLVLSAITAEMFWPRPAPAPVYWWADCLGLLALAAAVFFVSVWRVRRAAMRQLAGDPGGWLTGRRRAATGRIRRVRGSPVVWKELHTSLFGSRLLGALGWVLALGALVATYALFRNELGSIASQIPYGICLMALVGLSAAVISATGIAKEREAGTWPLLMATPLEDRQIVLGKAVATLRRVLPALLLLAFHFGIFTALGYLHPVVLLHLALIAAGLVALVTGSGLYFSTLVRRPTVAIVLNLGFSILVWAVIPLVISIAGSMIMMLWIAALRAPAQPWFFTASYTAYYSTHPLVQTGLVIYGAGGAMNAGRALAELRYEWMDIRAAGVVLTTGIVLALAAIHTFLGWVFLKRASARLRKRVF